MQPRILLFLYSFVISLFCTCSCYDFNINEIIWCIFLGNFGEVSDEEGQREWVISSSNIFLTNSD